MKNIRRKSAASLAAAVAIVVALSPTSSASSPSVSHPRPLVHYDLAKGEQPENVVVEPDGDLNVVLSRSAQVERVTPQGHRELLAHLPLPSDGGVHTPALGYSLATGLVRTDDGTLYVGYAAGDDNLTGIWRIRPGGRAQRIVPLTASSFPNGMDLDRRTGQLYFADSSLGVIWRVPLSGGAPSKWLSGPQLEASAYLGVNGLKLHNGAVWFSNSDQNSFFRVPRKSKGQAGHVQTRATGLTFLDDFAFVGRGNTVIAALNIGNEVVVIEPDGTHSTVLTRDDGLRGPTSVATSRGRLYALSASFVLQDDPNILVANLSRHS